jgi:hypothetical protein
MTFVDKKLKFLDAAFILYVRKTHTEFSVFV